MDAFEQEFAEFVGLPYCLALNSGTAAMHLALHHLGVGPGDEVFASTLTFIVSVRAGDPSRSSRQRKMGFIGRLYLLEYLALNSLSHSASSTLSLPSSTLKSLTPSLNI